MKKAIVLSLSLLFTTIFNYSFGRTSDNSGLPDEPARITTLIINADVTVVLTNNKQLIPEMMGNLTLTGLVSLVQTADTLLISSAREKNLKSAGIIYIPADQLRNIRINSEAHVSTLYSLRIPKLDVVINGTCFVNISNIGELNFFDTESYSFEQTREVRHIPAKLVRKELWKSI